MTYWKITAFGKAHDAAGLRSPSTNQIRKFGSDITEDFLSLTMAGR